MEADAWNTKFIAKVKELARGDGWGDSLNDIRMQDYQGDERYIPTVNDTSSEEDLDFSSIKISKKDLRGSAPRAKDPAKPTPQAGRTSPAKRVPLKKTSVLRAR